VGRDPVEVMIAVKVTDVPAQMGEGREAEMEEVGRPVGRNAIS
jgi:hypothetical protein